jgi:hypothetical protein
VAASVEPADRDLVWRRTDRVVPTACAALRVDLGRRCDVSPLVCSRMLIWSSR